MLHLVDKLALAWHRTVLRFQHMDEHDKYFRSMAATLHPHSRLALKPSSCSPCLTTNEWSLKGEALQNLEGMTLPDLEGRSPSRASQAE